MDIDFAALKPSLRYKLLTSLVVPRPIAWVTTLNANGSVNAAPYSFFNVMGNKPPIVCFGPGDREDGSDKDTTRNIKERGHFVVNLVHERLADLMHRTAAPFPPGTSETETLGIETEPSKKIETPRIKASKVHLECDHWGTVEVEGNHVVFGVIKHVHLRDGLVDAETFQITPGAFDGVGRLQGPGWYCSSRDRFDLGRFPSVDET